MKVLPTPSHKQGPTARPARPAQFQPWTGDALDDRPTTPYAITDRLPVTAPARRRPAAPAAPAARPAPVAQPAPPATTSPRLALPAGWLGPALALGAVVLLAGLLAVGSALAQRSGEGARGVPAPAVAQARMSVPEDGTAGLEPRAAAPGEADYLPTGIPVTRGDWVISKDYAAHGGLDPVARQKWGAVDFAFWQDKDAFGAEIIATHAGTVKLLEDDPTYGNLVYVMGSPYTTTYGHLERFNVTEGQAVRRGDVIGFMGSTGDSTGPHVDYQVWKDGENQNPMDYCQCGMKGPDAP
jgi:hypothetical protein